jgi:predicted dehydrogenase
MDRIRVGIIGANPTRGWAATAHVPALARLDEFELTAVATTREDSAAAAARAFGARHAFTGASGLASHPDVDLVVVSVRTAGHGEAVRAALAAGKHVFSEWPLAVGVDEAVDLADAAAAAGVVHTIGLQAYHSAGARLVRQIIQSGQIGRLESVSFVGAGDPLGGSRIPESMAWSTAPGMGTGLLMIMGGHTLAALDHIAGELAEVSAVVANLHEQVGVIGTAETLANPLAGQVAVAGRFASGAVASVSIHGGNASAPAGFVLTVSGTEGTVTATPADPAQYVNWARWRVRITPVDGSAYDVTVPRPDPEQEGPAANLAEVYREIAQAIQQGRPAYPNFHHAVRHQRTLAAIERASQTGQRQRIGASVA